MLLLSIMQVGHSCGKRSQGHGIKTRLSVRFFFLNYTRMNLLVAVLVVCCATLLPSRTTTKPQHYHRIKATLAGGAYCVDRLPHPKACVTHASQKECHGNVSFRNKCTASCAATQPGYDYGCRGRLPNGHLLTSYKSHPYLLSLY